MTNLLDNARNATGSGGRIWVEVTVEGPDCIVDVRDDGHGIADGDHERVFDRFVRARDGDPGNGSGNGYGAGGAGLGLPIARAIARAHEGELTSRAAPTGAWLRLRLPLARAPFSTTGSYRIAAPLGL